MIRSVNENLCIGDAQDYIFSKDQVKIDQQTKGVRTTEGLSRGQVMDGTSISKGQVIDGTSISMERDECICYMKEMVRTERRNLLKIECPERSKREKHENELDTTERFDKLTI